MSNYLFKNRLTIWIKRNYNKITIIPTSKENGNWFERSSSSKNQTYNLQLSTEEFSLVWVIVRFEKSGFTISGYFVATNFTITFFFFIRILFFFPRSGLNIQLHHFWFTVLINLEITNKKLIYTLFFL